MSLDYKLKKKKSEKRTPQRSDTRNLTFVKDTGSDDSCFPGA